MRHPYRVTWTARIPLWKAAVAAVLAGALGVAIGYAVDGEGDVPHAPAGSTAPIEEVETGAVRPRKGDEAQLLLPPD